MLRLAEPDREALRESDPRERLPERETLPLAERERLPDAADRDREPDPERLTDPDLLRLASADRLMDARDFERLFSWLFDCDSDRLRLAHWLTSVWSSIRTSRSRRSRTSTPAPKSHRPFVSVAAMAPSNVR